MIMRAAVALYNATSNSTYLAHATLLSKYMLSHQVGKWAKLPPTHPARFRLLLSLQTDMMPTILML